MRSMIVTQQHNKTLYLTLFTMLPLKPSYQVPEQWRLNNIYTIILFERKIHAPTLMCMKFIWQFKISIILFAIFMYFISKLVWYITDYWQKGHQGMELLWMAVKRGIKISHVFYIISKGCIERQPPCLLSQ